MNAGERPVLTAISPINPLRPKQWQRFGAGPLLHRFIYRLYDADANLIYVGITWNPHVRWSTHKTTKTWWTEVASIELWLCANERDARKWETACIKQQLPKYNRGQKPKVAA